jgi:hypothetical protein
MLNNPGKLGKLKMPFGPHRFFNFARIYTKSGKTLIPAGLQIFADISQQQFTSKRGDYIDFSARSD